MVSCGFLRQIASAGVCMSANSVKSLDQHMAPAPRRLRTNEMILRKELNLGPMLQTDRRAL